MDRSHRPGSHSYNWRASSKHQDSRGRGPERREKKGKRSSNKRSWKQNAVAQEFRRESFHQYLIQHGEEVSMEDMDEILREVGNNQYKTIYKEWVEAHREQIDSMFRVSPRSSATGDMIAGTHQAHMQLERQQGQPTHMMSKTTMSWEEICSGVQQSHQSSDSVTDSHQSNYLLGDRGVLSYLKENLSDHVPVSSVQQPYVSQAAYTVQADHIGQGPYTVQATQQDQQPYAGHAVDAGDNVPVSCAREFIQMGPAMQFGRGSHMVQAPNVMSSPHVGQAKHTMLGSHMGPAPYLGQASQTLQPQPSQETGELKLDEVKWLDKDEKMGQFFFNKVYQDAEKKQYWTPEGLSTSWIKLLSWEELVPLDGLERALVVYPRQLREVEERLTYFPDHVKLMITCEKARLHHPEHHMLWICPHHPGMADGCHCPQRRQVTVVHPPGRDHAYIRCNLLLLRYATHQRVVVISGSLQPVLWERTLQFNWYHDFPVDKNLDTSRGVPVFRSDLFYILKELNLRALGIKEVHYWLEHVNFEHLSPAIHLIISHPARITTAGVIPYYGIHKLQWRTSCVKYPLDQTESTLLTSYIGEGDGVKVLGEVFCHKATGALNLIHDKIKIVYPSTEHVDQAVRATADLEVTHLHDNWIKCMDSALDTRNNLWDTAETFPIHLGNAYMQTVQDKDKCFGWMSVGSHSLNPFSWGASQPRACVYKRFDVSVLCAPYRDDGEGVKEVYKYEPQLDRYKGDIHAVDLGCLLLPNFPISQYPWSSSPYVPDKSGEPEKAVTVAEPDTEMLHCIAKLVRLNTTRQFGFLDPPPKGHPSYMKFDSLPCQQYKGRQQSAFLHIEVWKDAKVPHEFAKGWIVEFNIPRDDPKLRIERIINVFQDWFEVYRAHDITPKVVEPPPKEPVPLANLFGSEPPEQESKEPEFLKRPTEEVLKENGIKTESDFQEFWLKKFEPSVMKQLQKTRFLEDVNLESEFSLEPWTSNVSDMAWLERHVRRRCKGSLPNKLVGPYDVEFVKKSFVGSRAAQVIGVNFPPLVS